MHKTKNSGLKNCKTKRTKKLQQKLKKKNLFLSQCLKITQNVAFDFFKYCYFSPIFVLLKLTCLVTLQFYRLLAKSAIFVTFDERLSTLNVNVARFARNNE